MQQVLMVILHVLLALVVLLLMVTIHELGHYIAGKVLKFKINEFAVGLGPKILQKKLKSGEKFSLRAIPLGGYCAFEDEDGTGEESKEPEKIEVFEEVETIEKPEKADEQMAVSMARRNFTDQKPWKRIIVFVAGAGFNILSAFIFSFIFLLVAGYAVPVVGDVHVMPNSAPIVTYSNLMPGDEIVAVNGRNITLFRSYNDMVEGIAEGEYFYLTVIRNGETLEPLRVVRQRIESYEGYYTVIRHDENGSITTGQVAVGGGADSFVGVGFMQGASARRSLGFGRSLMYTVPFTGELAGSIFRVFGMVFTGDIPVTDVVSGPVGAVGTMAMLTRVSMTNVLFLMAFLAINFAIFNLLPIPALDGSKIVFATIEWIRGKPVNRKVENWIHVVGFLVIFGLMIAVVTPMDIIRLIR